MAIYKNVLLVEGQDEKRTIPELIELNGINWGSGKNTIVHIKDYEGYENILKPGSISTELKADGIEALGILLDADEQPLDRWIAIRNACRNSKSVSKIPEELPEEGLIIEADNGVRVGIWIMPDNKLPGMLETFLGYLLPTASSSLWEFAGETIDRAKDKGAAFTDYHRDKAQIYSWLAWQKPPGRQLHQAIKERILDPQHPEAQQFVSWFRRLYGL
ncbi:DUF3226 domain-containing protein [Chamaesiphon sp. VAR_69_metabat_338]|uniref:DUF3226 domain-containing protein n=1 Tax=Chamaesiphon sp. VAR_69_metabat_338 TaxID=2964704 RepID=UPI00286E47E9|nr:DUF3226 domain-containing protein [Chamaesiphon sp. VAR_69_metabat_338]